jgi:hypothetical protein
MCLANYGASEAIYLCNGVEKIHQYCRLKVLFLSPCDKMLSIINTSVGSKYSLVVRVLITLDHSALPVSDIS